MSSITHLRTISRTINAKSIDYKLPYLNQNVQIPDNSL